MEHVHNCILDSLGFTEFVRFKEYVLHKKKMHPFDWITDEAYFVKSTKNRALRDINSSN